MTSYCADLVEDFSNLAESLAPSPEYLRAGRRAAQCVFEYLKQNGHIYNLKIGRTKITGSVGKNTGISYQRHNGTMKRPDFDLVVFLNERQPPFEDELEAIGDLVADVPNVWDVSTKEISVRFVYEDDEEGQIKFDLLPATNYVPFTSRSIDGASLATELALMEISDRQVRAISETSEINKEENRFLSSSFSESAVSFVKNCMKDNYVQNVVRLAKFWSSNLTFKTYIPAKSCTIELIAISAQMGKRRKKRCLISGFRRFLEAMRNFRNLQVSIGATKKHKDANFLKNIFPRDNLSMPIVLDPANPFNNLAGDLSADMIAMFETQAMATLTVLEGLKGRDEYEAVENAMDAIFRKKILKKNARH